MPEPIIVAQPTNILQAPRLSEHNLTSFNLRQNTNYIHHGVIYKFDFEEYNLRVERGRCFYDLAELDHSHGQLTAEEFEEIKGLYADDVATYYLIDVDGKECGKFDSRTREYIIFLRRIEIDSSVYYSDFGNQLYTYSGSCVGILSVDSSEIIRFNN